MAGKPNKKWMETMIKKHGSREAVRELMQGIGVEGGKVSKTGGFASAKVGKDGLTGKERASVAGSKGGKTSKRTKA